MITLDCKITLEHISKNEKNTKIVHAFIKNNLEPVKSLASVIMLHPDSQTTTSDIV